ncbi:MBL fold metallo-hydrolase [[Clostridium] colinum]|uniref:MBL fold metallo-hydrolase n=1 Tax=[Clostridium] colinum TaxID=36835 RepID=UPI00202596A9|nr:MBL fold metallo-hydrolase [[Clostridium] colinum]
MIDFTTLASGSKGNSIYIGTKDTKILIDAGLSAIKIENALKDINVSLDDIDAIFVTHEHSDHIDGIGVVSRKYNLPVYATEGTWNNMPQKIGKISQNNKRLVYKDEGIWLNDIFIKPFGVPHDAKEPVCYSVLYNGIKICVATDMGHITRDIIENIRHSSALVLESNHDVNMLKMGSYPYNIKERILGKYGHISNETCGKLLSCVMNNKLKNVFLGHISQDNNTPDLAYLTVSNILEEFGIQAEKDVNLFVAKPYGITEVITIKE